MIWARLLRAFEVLSVSMIIRSIEKGQGIWIVEYECVE